MTSVAVVVPSHQRAGPLSLLLDALARQTSPIAEVAVVLDGSTDGSERMLAARRDPFLLRWRHQPRRGAAAARNAGVAMTTAPIVLFLDDDVVPEPDCVARHLARHDGSRRAVVGDCPIVLPERPRPHDLSGWAWWLDFNHQRAARAGRAPSYRDVCTGNLSLRRDDLVAVGGFDEGFAGYGGEDWELGVRLLDSGVEVVAEPAAIARHHRRHTAADLLAHTRSEGRADVHFARRHPAVLGSLRLRYPPDGALGHAVRQAFEHPERADASLRSAVRRLAAIQPLRRWWTRFEEHRAVAYWWGVAETLGTWEAYEAFVAGVPRAATAVDVRHGIPAHIDAPEGVPCEIAVLWSDERVGTVLLPASSPRDRDEVARRISQQLSDQLLLRLGGEQPGVLVEQR
jgi:GT2 family glycosyltransferase